MNANLNEIFELINPANTIGGNRFLAHAIGSTEAVIYSALLAKSAYYEKRGMISDGWFFSTVADLEESTAFSEKQQRRAIDKLIKAGLIRLERRGMPAKRFFKVSENLDKLKEIIALGEKIVAQKFGAGKTCARENIDLITANEFSEYSKRENCEAALSDVPCSSAETSEQEPPKAPNKFRQNAAVPYKTKNNNHNKKSSSGDDEIQRENFLSALKKNICYAELCCKCPNDRKIIDNILEIMLDVICSKKDKVRVNGDNKAHSVVTSAFLKLKKEHFLSALNAIESNPNPVFYQRGYIITVLYNSLYSVNYPGCASASKTACTANSRKSSFNNTIDKLMAQVMANYRKGSGVAAPESVFQKSSLDIDEFEARVMANYAK